MSEQHGDCGCGPEVLISEENLARRIKYEMERRGWSQERLAREMTEAGYPIHQTSVGKIVSPGSGKRRSISVDDALGFSKVFGIPLQELLIPVESVLDTELRQSMARILKWTMQREDLERSITGETTNLVRLISELKPEDVEKLYSRADPEDRRKYLEQMYRWGHRLMQQLRSGALDDVPDEEVLERLRAVTHGERFDQGDQA